MGDKSHLKLNTRKRPIANKYREGKVKRTLNRELKVLEIATSYDKYALKRAQAQGDSRSPSL